MWVVIWFFVDIVGVFFGVFGFLKSIEMWFGERKDWFDRFLFCR